MAKEKKGQGFQSAAGLIRYFDTETDKALQLPPWLVIGFAIGATAIITAAWLIWPL